MEGVIILRHSQLYSAMHCIARYTKAANSVACEFSMKIFSLHKKPESIPQIAQWHFDEWRALYPQKTLDDFESDLRESLTGADIPQTWLLMEDDEICGTASVLRHDMKTHTELSPWLANIFIRKERRGLGFGKTLVLWVMNEIKRLGVREIYLFTEDQRAFYEKLGWASLGQEIYEGKPVVVMRFAF